MTAIPSAIATWTVWGDPIPQPRPRVVGRRAIPDTGRVLEAKETHRMAAGSALPPSWPLGAVYAVYVKCWRATYRRCDVDNLAKLPLDAVTGIVWDDDSQIATLHIEKAINVDDPRTEVTVYVIAESMPERVTKRRKK